MARDRCSACGDALTAAEIAAMDADTDFIPHGDRGHLIGRTSAFEEARRRAEFPYVVTEVDRAGSEHEFAACRDPFTAGRLESWLHGRLGRWGVAVVRMDGREDEHFNEDREGERFFDRLSDDEVRAFVAATTSCDPSALDRRGMIDSFYALFYGDPVAS